MPHSSNGFNIKSPQVQLLSPLKNRIKIMNNGKLTGLDTFQNTLTSDFDKVKLRDELSFKKQP